MAHALEQEKSQSHAGAATRLTVWCVTPGEAWLASLFGNPVMLPITRFTYDRFAEVLFAWNKWKGR